MENKDDGKAQVVIDSMVCLKNECQKPREEQDIDLIAYCIERMEREKYINKLVKGCYDSSLMEIVDLLESKYQADQLVMEVTLESAQKDPEAVKTAIKRDFECRKTLVDKIKKERETREKLLNAIFNSEEPVTEDY